MEIFKMKKLYLVYPQKKGIIAPEIYGHFTEHIGGVIYDGIWVGRDSEIPNIKGFRKYIVEKLKAINEAKRVVRKGGYILIMYLMNEYAVITYAFKEGNLQKVLAENKLDKDFQTQTTTEDLYSYVRLEEINKLKDDAELIRTQIIGVDGPTDYMRQIINKLSAEDFEIYKNYILSISPRQELLGASSHILDILQK
jgi:hypothetical protein